MTTARIDKLEELLAHQTQMLDELNSVVTSQSGQIDTIQRRLALLMKRAAEQESDSVSGAPLTDQKPPHW